MLSVNLPKFFKHTNYYVFLLYPFELRWKGEYFFKSCIPTQPNFIDSNETSFVKIFFFPLRKIYKVEKKFTMGKKKLETRKQCCVNLMKIFDFRWNRIQKPLTVVVELSILDVCWFSGCTSAKWSFFLFNTFSL